MIAYLSDLYATVTALLPVLLAVAALTLVALVLDALCAPGEW